MKRLIATLGVVALATAAFAQGTVSFFNTAETRFFTNSILVGGTFDRTAASTTQLYYWEVLTAPSTVTTVDPSLQQLLAGPWSDTGASGTNTAATGRMQGSTAASNGGAFVNNWAAGATNSFIIVGWSSEEGTTWAQVAARVAGAQFIQQGTNGYWLGGFFVPGGFFGATAIGTAISAPTNAPAPDLFGAASSAQSTPVTGTTQLFIAIVPEPSAVALVGLGAASLLIVRRRK